MSDTHKFWCKRAIFWGALGLTLLALGACAARGGRFSGRNAYTHVRRLVALGPRAVGTPGNRQAGDYIIRHLERYGWEVSTQEFAYGDENLRNIIARKGHGPIVLLGTHYDTRPLADRDPSDRTQPVPGANDGGSGVGVLLELGRILGPPATEQAEIWLVFFDGEDRGEIEGWPYSVGAYQMVSDLARSGAAKPSYVVVVDMVGDADQTIYYEWSSTMALQEHIWGIAERLGYGAYFKKQVRHHILDDHTPFVQWGVPAALLIDFDYRYWHTTQDTSDKISADSLQRVGAILETLLNEEPFVVR